MPGYVYRARNQDGGEVRGDIAASSPEEARRTLRSRGLFVLELNSSTGGGLFQRIARLLHRAEESRSRP